MRYETIAGAFLVDDISDLDAPGLFDASAFDLNYIAGSGNNMSQNGAETQQAFTVPSGDAFLVIREGDVWGEVITLTPGQVITVGRAPTNRVVLHDEICSRNHCEIFQSNSKWVLRDLESRNGTRVDNSQVEDDWELFDGEMIQIGRCALGFTYDPAQTFLRGHDFSDDGETDVESKSSSIRKPPEASILHRTGQTRFRNVADQKEAVAGDRTSRELAKLYRLALDMGTSQSKEVLAQTVLEGILEGTQGNIGAVLLLPPGNHDHLVPDMLDVVSYMGGPNDSYEKVSNYLSTVVMEGREAVLARDVAIDDALSTRDSLGEIRAQSVICAPICIDETLFGLIHLYSTNLDNRFDPDDLEFTLAVADQLAVALKNWEERDHLADGLAIVRGENEVLREQLGLECELVGESPPIQRLREDIGRIATTEATTLVRGESGVGKELVAHAIHFSSARRDRPFVCMNCAALNESLLESELFGHEKGSFTGAFDRKIGRFEQAHEGTLFLDEVGEMSLTIQAKFLRVLENHPFERIGGRTPINVDVRVVAATNRDLETAVRNGKFRQDLYYRLQVVEILVPPLRERPGDVPLLAEFFLNRFAHKTSRRGLEFSPEALSMLAKYDWPGNVRELQNAVERAVILCRGTVISEADIRLSALPIPAGEGAVVASVAGSREVSLEELEKEHILATLDQTDWNKSRAAQILGIERSTLDRKLKRYQVSRPG